MIVYSSEADTLRADQLIGFFVGWPMPPSPEQLRDVLRASYRVIVALDDQTNRTIGFVNALSDGMLTAFIPWLEVLPSYQAQGIGTELMRRMLDALADLYSVDLVCDAELTGFYERHGMFPLQAMGVRDRSAIARIAAS